MKPLTPRQARFVAEYSARPIAAVAARRAGYSPQSARNGGAVLLRNPAVAAALAKAGGQALARIELSAERALAEAMRVAFADIADIVEPDGTPRPLAAIDAAARAGFAAIESLERPGKPGTRVLAIERFDKLAALAFLARHAGLLDADTDTAPAWLGPIDTEAADEGRGETLTARQTRFVAEYAADFNATRAALAAGYAPSLAQQHGSRLLKRPAIRRALDRTSAALVDRSGLDPARVLREIGRIAFSDIGRLFDGNGRLKPLGEVDPDTRAALHSLRIREHAGRRRIRARLFDKTRALRLLFRHFGPPGETAAQEERDAALGAAIDAALARAP